MKPKIIIIGSSGHAKVVVDVVEQEKKYEIVGIIDQAQVERKDVLGYPIIGEVKDLAKRIKEKNISGGIIGIGDNFIRSKVVQEVKASLPEFPFVCAIHPTAFLGKGAKVGVGSVLMAGAKVNPDSRIGAFCILNTNSSLDHDSQMGDYSSLAPNVATGGNVSIGSYSAIGIGAAIIHGCKVGFHSVVGAGSTVLKDIGNYEISYGTPAKFIRTRKEGEKYL